jgi:predicted component of type VI protein secretion system
MLAAGSTVRKGNAHMILRYKKQDGTQMEFELGDRPITIGRGTEADLVILDEKASRLHCGIRVWDGDFLLKDLKSKNGTFVNGERVDMARLDPGDQIRIGNCLFAFESDPAKGAETMLREVANEMADGKGYSTLLKEIVSPADADEPAPLGAPPSAPSPSPADAAQPAPPSAAPISGTGKPAPRRVMKIRIRPPDAK